MVPLVKMLLLAVIGFALSGLAFVGPGGTVVGQITASSELACLGSGTTTTFNAVLSSGSPTYSGCLKVVEPTSILPVNSLKMAITTPFKKGYACGFFFYSDSGCQTKASGAGQPAPVGFLGNNDSPPTVPATVLLRLCQAVESTVLVYAKMACYPPLGFGI